jgi:hypothetical protein
MIYAFLILVILHAFIDGKLIKANKTIHHTLEYVVFLIVCLLVSFLLKENLIKGFIYSTITRTAFFNFCLNKFRGLSFTYQSTTTTSATDITLHKIEDIIYGRFGIRIKDYYINILFIIIYLIAIKL